MEKDTKKAQYTQLWDLGMLNEGEWVGAVLGI